MSRPFRAIFNTITTKNTEPRLGAIFFSDPSFVNWIRWVRVDLSHQFYFMQVLLIKFSCKWPCSFDNTISGVDWPDEVVAIMLLCRNRQWLKDEENWGRKLLLSVAVQYCNNIVYIARVIRYICSHVTACMATSTTWLLFHFKLRFVKLDRSDVPPLTHFSACSTQHRAKRNNRFLE